MGGVWDMEGWLGVDEGWLAGGDGVDGGSEW